MIAELREKVAQASPSSATRFGPTPSSSHGPPTMGPPSMSLPARASSSVGAPSYLAPHGSSIQSSPGHRAPTSAPISSPSARGPSAVPTGTFVFRGPKAGQYSEIIDRFRSDTNALDLINTVLAGGNLTIMTSDDDDTRYVRATRTIHVHGKGTKSQASAAILFELCNAANDHRYTDAAESGLGEMATARAKPTGADYIHVAKEMEKDEFVSLTQYAHIASTMHGADAVMRQKYDAVEASSGGLSYDKYVEQNARSSHTLDLAKAQQQNYTGGYEEISNVPLQYVKPEAYYGATGGATKSRRSAGLVIETLRREEEAGMNRVDSRLTSKAPPFDPAEIASRFGLPVHASGRSDAQEKKESTKTDDGSS
jgi:hypothetical protein